MHVLLEKGADLNAKTLNMFSPLHFAIKLKYARIVYDLLQNGADFHSLVDCNTESPKITQVCLKSNRSEKLVRSTFKPRYTTVLHIASESNYQASLLLIISAGTTVDNVQYDGTTLLIVDIKRRYNRIAKMLMDFRSKFRTKNQI